MKVYQSRIPFEFVLLWKLWLKPGGGISRVLQDGDVFDKAGVNVSVVYGVFLPKVYRAARSVDNGNAKPGPGHPIPFFAAGVSSVLHPKNPFAPTVHFNYGYFETDAPQVIRSVGLAMWKVLF